MGDRAFKVALYRQFARLGKALASSARLELLDLLAQGERSVDELAAALLLRRRGPRPHAGNAPTTRRIYSPVGCRVGHAVPIEWENFINRR